MSEARVPPARTEPAHPELKPLYAQIQERLIHRVVKGEWGPGEMLPSEMRLAAEYGVHQGTVRKALDEMAALNLVYRQQGKGTFVAAAAMRHNTFHFFRMHSKADPSERPKTRFLSCTRAKASAAERLRLNLDEGAEVVRSLRVREYGEKATIVERVVQPSDLFPGLEDLLMNRQPETTYGLLEEKYRVLIVRVVERLTAVEASAEDNKLLGEAKTSALLEIDRVAYAIDGRPVEWRVSRSRTDDHEYMVELH